MEIHRGKKIKVNLTKKFEQEEVLEIGRSLMRIDRSVNKIVLKKKEFTLTLTRSEDDKMQST